MMHTFQKDTSEKSTVTSSLPGVSLKTAEVLQRLHPLSLWYRLYRAFFSATDSSDKFLIFFPNFFIPCCFQG